MSKEKKAHSTSLNSSKMIKSDIERISSELGITRSKLIKEILWYCLDNLDFAFFLSGLARYQKKYEESNWKCIRLDLNELECDLFLLCRFKFRISVSKLLAVGFVLFIEDVINKLSGNEEKKANVSSSYTETVAFFKEKVKDEFYYFVKTKKNTT